MSERKTKRNEKILKLAKAGKTIREIAKQLKLHFTTVHKIIQRGY